jgi:hypothetical protein
MSDRELLELAANAMGYGDGHWEDGSWLEVRYGPTCAWWSEKMFDETDEGYWNPLESAAQAFYAAAKMGLTVDFNTGTVRGPMGDLLAISEIDVRHAIVRAIAVMAKTTA